MDGCKVCLACRASVDARADKVVSVSHSHDDDDEYGKIDGRRANKRPRSDQIRRTNLSEIIGEVLLG